MSLLLDALKKAEENNQESSEDKLIADAEEHAPDVKNDELASTAEPTEVESGVDRNTSSENDDIKNNVPADQSQDDLPTLEDQTSDNNELSLSLEEIEAEENLSQNSSVFTEQADEKGNGENESVNEFDSLADSSIAGLNSDDNSGTENSTPTEAFYVDNDISKQVADDLNLVNVEETESAYQPYATSFEYIEASGTKSKVSNQVKYSLLATLAAITFVIAWWYITTTLQELSKPSIKQLPAMQVKNDTNIKKPVNASDNIATQAVAQNKVTQKSKIITTAAASKVEFKTKQIASTVNYSKQTSSPRDDHNRSGILYPTDNVYISDINKPLNNYNKIEIKRDSRQNVNNHILLDAYKAYQQSKHKKAKALYQSYLRVQPNNRDALLGLAAIALRLGSKLKAQNYYFHLLKLDPQDSIALTALLSLQNTAAIDREASISKLKLMSEQDMGAAHLHFALGMLYINQNRWIEAQSAFFKAFQLDRGNADYAYNLAVSLDQLREYKAASRYYKSALKISYSSPYHFNRRTTKKRLRSLGYPLSNRSGASK